MRPSAGSASAVAGLTKRREQKSAQADLAPDEGWAQAMRSFGYLLHVASLLPREFPRHEDDLIAPGRAGTLRVLWIPAESAIERVVMTPSLQLARRVATSPPEETSA